jgi:hypothetical protein
MKMNEYETKEKDANQQMRYSREQMLQIGEEGAKWGAEQEMFLSRLYASAPDLLRRRIRIQMRYSSISTGMGEH